VYLAADTRGWPLSFVFCGVTLWSGGLEKDGKVTYNGGGTFLKVTRDEIRTLREDKESL